MFYFELFKPTFCVGTSLGTDGQNYVGTNVTCIMTLLWIATYTN